jgi:hypothetical protein
MISFMQVIGLVVGVGVLLLGAVMAGGWLVFRSKAGPGEGFVRTPKGQVFTVEEAALAPDDADTPAEVLARTEKFLEGLMGGKQ